ncbi:MAG: hypothetical protein C5S49_07700 [Candidatus Methanogaster sp.]|nr:MAG: hypothetical protein C5S49_07700 [ANME-2 cluster archaeon]
MIKIMLYESERYVIFSRNQTKENTIMIALNKKPQVLYTMTEAKDPVNITRR